ncbi:MAG: hypothetical protein KatS3mg050_1625 [Litorilinea sp.]|nr:MAG: hypothetical protein KatS3mg050_1625 [Litorilinea sp.]
MAWISLDELLEQIVLAVYARWHEPELAGLQPELDQARRDLAHTLTTLAEDAVPVGEDAILAFLDRLAAWPEVVACAPEAFGQVATLREALLRRRQGGRPVRGTVVKATDLSPARRQDLVALLEEGQPAVLAIRRRHYPRDPGQWAILLEEVLDRLYFDWDQLPLAIRQELLDRLAALAPAVDAGHSLPADQILALLTWLEAQPAVVAIAAPAFLAHKLAQAPKTIRHPGQRLVTVGSRLATMITQPPSVDAQLHAAAIDRMEAAPAEPFPAELMEAAPAEGQEAPGQEVRLHTDVQFPRQVQAGAEVPLVVRLTLEQVASSLVAGQLSVTFDQLSKPEYVEVVLVAPGFKERTQSWSRTMAVYSDRDSQPAIFLLQAGDELGPRRLTLDFYHKDRYLGSAPFQVEITATPTQMDGGVELDGRPLLARFLTQPPPPADLELRIVKGSRENVLNFVLHSARAGVGYHWRPVGQVELTAANPAQYLEHIFEQMSSLAARPVERLSEADAAVAQGDIINVGQRLFQELFPPELKAEYWRKIRPLRRDEANPQGLIRTLLITSDEPWIPWEMVKPYELDPDTGEERSDGFLAETFQVSRWLAGRGPADAVQVRRAAVVVPRSDLAYTAQEEQYFRQLAENGRVDVPEPLHRVQEFLQLAQEGSAELIHFAAHGRFEADNADLSPLSFEDGALTPEALSGQRVRGLVRTRPLVFLNACHTARLAFTLTGLGGWAEKLVDQVGVSAFVGTLWEVNDLLAAEFAIRFYEELRAGATLGQAFHRARLHIRDRQPANPTWLAYVLYGDPNSTVRFGRDGESRPEGGPSELSPADVGLDLEQVRASLRQSLAASLQAYIEQNLPQLIDAALARVLDDSSTLE